MKKLISIFMVYVMLFSVSSIAFAESYKTSHLNPGAGVNAGTGTKRSSTGTASFVYPSTSTANAIFQATTRKTDGVNASSTVQFTGTNTVKLTTLYDGNRNASLRYNYSYVLRIAHRSKSPVTGSASTSGTWNP